MITAFWTLASVGCSLLYASGDPPAAAFLYLAVAFAFLAWRAR